MRLLLVEDDQLLAEGVIVALQRAGYSVDWVTNGSDAIATIRATDFSIAIFDLGLPDMDGLALLEKVRTDEQQTMPVLILTARDQLDDKIAGLDAGADDYLPKPFAVDELLA